MDKYIEYFKKLGIVITPDSKSVVIAIDINNNFVSIYNKKNKKSDNYIYIINKFRIMTKHITLKISNYCNWTIRHTKSYSIIMVDKIKLGLDIKNQYTINIH